MIIMRRKLLLLMLCCILGSMPSAYAQTDIPRTVVYEAGMQGYSTFRIPAIIRTKKGALLAFAEARKDGSGDAGNIDLVVRRSDDGGRTWGDINIVWDDGGNTCGNPAPVVDRRSGRVVLLMTWNRGEDSESEIMSRQATDSRRVFVCHSDDEGRSWSTPQDITSTTKLPDWTWYATGPCHAIQLWNKPYRGRLVVPSNHAVYNGKGSDYSAHLIISDDGGESWRIGGIMAGGNESTVVELADGRLMHNARWQSGDDRFARHYTISNDGGNSSGAVVRDATLIEPVCQGSIIGYSPRGRATNNLLFCNPASTSRRERLTLRQSRDGGANWDDGILLVEGKAAYSDIVVLKDGDVGVLYETGVKSPYERIEYVIVPKSQLK